MIPLDILLAAIGVTALLFLTVGMCIAPQRKRWPSYHHDRREPMPVMPRWDAAAVRELRASREIH